MRATADPARRVALYLVPRPRAAEVARHYQAHLGIPPQHAAGTGTEGEYWFFHCGAATGCPSAATGLSIAISASPWADDQAQILMQFPGEPTFTRGPRPPVYP